MRHLILVLAALCVGANAKAQNTGRVSGTVTAAEDGHPLAGARVGVLGTNRTGFTNERGVYLIDQVPTGSQRVQARFLGYAPLVQAVTVESGQAATANFQMVAAPVELEGVVVTAYGQQERRDVTGAISELNMEDIKDIPVPNPVQMLQGRVPGVDIVTGGGYRPGAPMNVRVRGVRSMTASNDPLYVVDGVPILNIADFNPAFISSVTVLKDASATAAYGAAGANGVILITTNRGSPGVGGTSSLTYDVQYGTQSALQLANMMNGPEIFRERVDAARLAGRDTTYTSVFNAQQLVTVNCILDPAAHPGCSTGTDWQRSILRTGNQQQHRIGYNSISGTSRLSLTGTYFDQNGITVGQDYKQYSGTVSFENTFGRLRVGVTATGSRSVADIGGDSQLWGEATANDPLGLPYVDSLGVPTGTNCSSCTLNTKPTSDALRVNPLLEQQGYVQQQIRSALFGSAFAEVTLGHGFTYRVNFGEDLVHISNGRFQAAQVVVGSTPLGNAQADFIASENFQYTLDNILTWNLTTGPHKVETTLLYDIGQTRFQLDSAAARNLPYDYQLWYNLGTGDAPQPPSSNYRLSSGRSYMARVNYTFRDRYSLTATGRYDGSSVLAPGHKWSFFPSFGLSWQVGDEPFMRPLRDLVSGLKLRGSFGTTGNSAINPYQTEGSLSRTLYNFGSASAAGYEPGTIPNPDLVWEKTTQLDIGVDFGFLKNRISGTFDVYREKTSDLLLSRQLPPSTGFTSTLQNIGKTGNAGWELSISTVNIPGTHGGLKWTTDLNFTHNQNYIISLAGGVGDDQGNRWFIGQPINVGGGNAGAGAAAQGTGADALHNVFYDLKFIGIWQLADSALARQYGQKPGDIRVADLNGDGKIDGFDRVIRGNTYPRLIASVYNRATWKGFDLSFLLQGRIGYTFQDGFLQGAKLFERYNFLNVQYWTPEKCDGGPNPNVYDPVAGMTAQQQAALPGCNSVWAPSAGRENPLYNDVNFVAPTYRVGTHWRLRNVTLGYTLPASVARYFKASSVRIYAVAQDPIVFTSYKGYDPEFGGAAGPPNYKTFLIGATLGF
jgi:TonB-linked SusC/RagA family outer membrane protein